jgi:hypothetical protein
MNKTALVHAFILVVAASAIPRADAQTVSRTPTAPTTQVRDPTGRPAPTKVGNATVSGTVTSPTGHAVIGARVMLQSPELAGGMSVVSDGQGAFAFSALAAGRYTVNAVKPGYVTYRQGQRSVRNMFTSIVLADGEAKTVGLQLARGGVITGTVLDERGEPAINVPVVSMRYQFVGGQRRPQQMGQAMTDDRGIYRIHSLDPGEYNVCVTARPGMNFSMMSDAQRLQMELEGMRNALANANRNNMPGAARESMQTRLAQLEARLATTNAEPATGYGPVCAITGSGAMLPIAAAEERGGVDIQLQLVPVSRVEGTVIAPQGVAIGGPGPQGVQIQLMSLDESSGRSSNGTSVDQATGRFRFQSVAPGTYRLVARMGQFGMPPPMPSGAGAAPGTPHSSDRYWASADFTAAGQEVVTVNLDLQPALTVSGQFVFQGTKLQPPDPSRIRINLSPMAVFPYEGGMMPAQASVDANGRFTVAGVLPGKYRINASGDGGWSADSAVVAGNDALDAGLDMTAGRSVKGLVITMTDQQTSLSGLMLNEKGAPATEHTLLVYPADEKLWVPESRRFRTMRVGADGKYQIRGLPPGDYRLAAFLDAEPGAWYDPAFLEQLNDGSLRLSLIAGEEKVQNVRVGQH